MGELRRLTRELGQARIQTSVILVLVCTLLMGAWSTQLQNVAVGKPTLMDSVYMMGGNLLTGDKCVDGDQIKRGLEELSCSATDVGQEVNWWIVDLLREYAIQEVIITNRNGYGDALQNFTVDVFKHHPNAHPGFPYSYGQVCARQLVDGTYPQNGHTKTYPCTQAVSGRYVRVVKYGYSHLVMCEVQVMTAVPASMLQFSGTVHRDTSTDTLPYETLNTAHSYMACALLCVQDGRCNAFSWKPNHDECGFHNISIYQSPSFTFVAENGTDFTVSI